MWEGKTNGKTPVSSGGGLETFYEEEALGFNITLPLSSLNAFSALLRVNISPNISRIETRSSTVAAAQPALP
ncbi:hypothetical protein PM082_013299 [Marasmius tenuissimus]|nr:hypothetical protein PM082_013299 [Marasmius tenuissimus]